MSVVVKSRRRQRRYAVSRDNAAWVEFEHAGRAQRREVCNLSAAGVSFTIEDGGDPSSLPPGTALRSTRLRIGDCLIRGEMVVMHVSRAAEGCTICGALFYPAADDDLLKLRSVIAGMEIAGGD